MTDGNMNINTREQTYFVWLLDEPEKMYEVKASSATQARRRFAAQNETIVANTSAKIAH